MECYVSLLFDWVSAGKLTPPHTACLHTSPDPAHPPAHIPCSLEGVAVTFTAAAWVKEEKEKWEEERRGVIISCPVDRNRAPRCSTQTGQTELCDSDRKLQRERLRVSGDTEQRRRCVVIQWRGKPHYRKPCNSIETSPLIQKSFHSGIVLLRGLVCVYPVETTI